MVYLVLDKQCLLLPLCGVFYKGQLSCLIALFMFAVPFLIFCLVVLSINKNGISSLSTLYYFLLLILSIFASCIWRCYIFIQERLKHKGMYTNVHGSFIHHSKKKKGETIQISFKHNVAYLHNRILFSNVLISRKTKTAYWYLQRGLKYKLVFWVKKSHTQVNHWLLRTRSSGKNRLQMVMGSFVVEAENGLYLNCISGFTAVYIWQNLSYCKF